MKRNLTKSKVLKNWYRAYCLASSGQERAPGQDPEAIGQELRSLLSPVLGARPNGLFQSGS